LRKQARVEYSRCAQSLIWDSDPHSLLDRLHLLRDGRPTVGAVLLFGLDPQRVLPQATVRLHVHRGAVEEGAAIEGGLLRQIEDTVRQIQVQLRRLSDRSGMIRRETDELPAIAVREVVVNALAHRDYRSTAPTQVRLDDQRLKVWSPGHLPEPLTVAALQRAHPSVPPNPRIARALFLAGFVEEWGTGTLRAESSMREQGNADPVFEASLGGISVTLPLLHPEDVRFTARQGEVLARLGAAPGPCRAAELASSLGVSARTLQNDLNALEKLGRVTRVGQGDAIRWAPVR
jgi:ATP-dependent DNA helicase RecG